MGFRTRALGTLFHKMNNDLMTINGIEPSRRVSSLLKGLFRRQRSILFSLAKTKKINYCNWNRPPLPFLGYMASSAIWLLQNFLPTTYRPPLPSRLLKVNLHSTRPSHALVRPSTPLPPPDKARRRGRADEGVRGFCLVGQGPKCFMILTHKYVNLHA